jgi:phosphoribosylformylglycinamidine (FGAM) synthase-like enzyme
MAGGKTSTHEAAVLNVMRATTLTAFTGYASLFSVAPTDTTAGTEVTGGGYARAAITFGAPTGSGPSSMSNSVEILITMPTISVVAVGIHDASTAGNLRYFVGITTVAFTSGDQARFAIGALTVTEE